MAGLAITILAAASLVDVLPQLAADWSKISGSRVSFSFDASSRLAKQAESGAPADGIVTADLEWMAYLEKKGVVARGASRILARNRLVAVAPAGSKLEVSNAAGLETAAFKRLALAGESVPAGRYARQALGEADVYETLLPRVARGDSARTVLRWVAQGEADVGIVYASDAASEPRVRLLFMFPKDSHASIVYPAAALARSKHKRLAEDFLKYCASKAARPRWHEAGFPAAEP